MVKASDMVVNLMLFTGALTRMSFTAGTTAQVQMFCNFLKSLHNNVKFATKVIFFLPSPKENIPLSFKHHKVST